MNPRRSQVLGAKALLRVILGGLMLGGSFTRAARDDEQERRQRALATLEQARQLIGGPTLKQLQTLSGRAKLQRFIPYVSVQGPNKVIEKSKTLKGKIELDFALPDRFRKRTASSTLSGFGYAYAEIINGDKAWRDPPLRVQPQGNESRVIDVRDVERTLNLQTQSTQQQVSIYALLCLLQTPATLPVQWTHAGVVKIAERPVEVLTGAGNDGFRPLLLFDQQTKMPRGLAFTYVEAIRPTVLVEVAALDRSFLRGSFMRASQERRARTQPARRHEMSWTTSDYRPVKTAQGTIQLPHRIEISRDGELLETVVFNEFKLDRSIKAGRFEGEPKVVY